MSAKGFAKRRDQNEPLIVAVLESMGAVVHKLSEKGMPDLLVGHRGVTHLVEVKGPRGRMTPDQLDWHRAWEVSGCRARVVVTPEDAVIVLGGVSLASTGDAGIWAWCPASCALSDPNKQPRVDCTFGASHLRGTYPRTLHGGK